jgi:hypothetical protein
VSRRGFARGRRRAKTKDFTAVVREFGKKGGCALCSDPECCSVLVEFVGGDRDGQRSWARSCVLKSHEKKV